MITSSAPPLSDARARGLHPARSLLMALIRVVVLLAADVVYARTIPASADPVGAGLTGFLITVSIAGVWALVDGWRRPLRTAAVAWLVASVLFVAASPLIPALGSSTEEGGGWTGLADYLATATDTVGVMLALVALPAAVGLGLGAVIRRSLRTAAG